MGTEALRNYIKSIESMKAGEVKAAEANLAASLGIPELTPFMKENLKDLTDLEKSNVAILTIINARVQEEN